MKVTAVTPPDAASSPDHPDHDRWVKETTLRMEVEHAQRLGLGLRHAEEENARLLARAEAKAAAAPAPVKRPVSPSDARAKRHADRGITRRAALKAPRPECGCGLCLLCRRKLRVLAIFQARASAPAMKSLGDDLFAAFLSASTGIGSYKGLSKRDAKRALSVKIDAICDRSVPLLGAWR